MMIMFYGADTKCADPEANLPFTILPIIPGDMLANGVAAKPPKPAPIPTIETIDFVDPPLPPVAKLSEPTANDTSTPADADSTSNTTTPAAPKPSKSTKLDGNIILTIVIVMVGALSILSIH